MVLYFALGGFLLLKFPKFIFAKKVFNGSQ